jgi:thioredoxin 1
MAQLLEVTEASFEQEILRAALPTVVDFWAEWCGPCRALGQIREKLGAEYRGKVKVAKRDVQANPDIAARYGVLNLPTLLLFVGGEMRERLGGMMPLPKLVQKLGPYLG